MTHRNARTTLAILAWAVVACFASSTSRAQARPDTLADSTWVERWKLANGLEVTVRHIPQAFGVSVVTAYHVGRNADPKDRAGLADLACEVLFTAAAGDVPERTREQLDALRSLGWKLQVTPRFTLLSEVASKRQFPGVLRQVATRMRGVTVTDSVLERARRTLMRDQGHRFAEAPEDLLAGQLRDVAAGVTDEEFLGRLTGQTIRDVTVRELDARLRRLYVPANAVLALAGNLDGIDVHTLVHNLFEGIPGGTAQPEAPAPPLKAAGRTYRRAMLHRALGGVGILAPAITDTLSPDFYLNTLIIASYCESEWGPAKAPLTARFRYPIFADPDVAEYFPPVDDHETDADQLGIAMQDVMGNLAEVAIKPESVAEQRLNYQWIFGGPLTVPLRRRAEEDSGTLQTLASTMAVRALWGSNEFWAKYLARFMNPAPVHDADWTDYFQAPSHIVRLLFTPTKP